MKERIDIKAFLPEEVLAQYRIDLDGDEQGGPRVDQYGVQWERSGFRGQFGPLFPSLGTLAGIGVVGLKKAEESMWPAFTKSLPDTVIAGITALRGPHENPMLRIERTRAYFKAVIGAAVAYAKDMCQVLPVSALCKEERFVNGMHRGAGVLDPDTGLVPPEQQRSFAFVMALTENQMQKAFDTHPAAQRLKPSLHELWWGAIEKLGMPLAPVDTGHFLDVHRKIIVSSREWLAQNAPEILSRTDGAAQGAAQRTRDVFDKRGIPLEKFLGQLDAFEREVLKV